ncbi:hypothetical protein FRC11_000426 [Ceratobasidium sp. 423]|nr:hypothetical protein FRC11_000426 [Ceratobasidium sp. 423]
MLASQFVVLACIWARFAGAVTVYGVKTAKTIGTSQAYAAVATLAAYDQTVLTSPSPPSPAITNNFLVQLYPGTMAGLSIKQSGSFMGYSIELSVVEQTLGKNSTRLLVPFLNYMANIRARGGSVSIRVGGNSQDTSYLVDSIPNYGVVTKQKPAGATTPTETPDVVFSADLLTMMKNIGDLVNANFYFGLNFHYPDNETNAILVAQTAEKILGDRLLGFQLGNEPDLYGPHGHNDQHLNGASLSNNQVLIGPSTCCNWNETQLFNMEMVQAAGKPFPFTPPPTNLSSSFGWTTGAVYYSTLLIAEAFGKSGNAQIVDLGANSNNDNTPAYAIYENGNPVRVVLFNYIDDPTGANDYTANIAIGGQQTGQASTTPSSVQVRYMRAPSLGSHNVTWAGQNLGGELGSDGRMQGTQETITIQCDTTAQTCAIPVKAPSIALVFLTDSALTESSPDSTVTQTFPTSAVTNKGGSGITVSVASSVLATSNGRGAAEHNLLGSTSQGSLNSAPARMQASAAAISATFVALSAAFFMFSTGVFAR